MRMMQGMMGMNPAAMQMAMMQQMGPMGMMHPSYMQAMQQQQQMMMGKDGRKGRAKPGEGSSSDSGDSSSSSSDSSAPGNGGFNPAAAMAAMAAMQHQWPASASAGPPPQAKQIPGMPPPPPPPPPPPGTPGYGMPPGAGGALVDCDEEVEAFLVANPVNEEAADRLRALPPHLQTGVMKRGPVSDTRNPSGVLLARVRDAEIGKPEGTDSTTVSEKEKPAAAATSEAVPARKSHKAAIEAMINDYRLAVNVSWTMRALPPDKQKLAAKIDPSGQADPSGYVAEELKKIV